MISGAEKKDISQKLKAFINKRFNFNYAKAFAHYDPLRNPKGKIDAQSLAALLKDMDIGTMTTRLPMARDLLAALDKDLDKNITWKALEQFAKS